MKEADLYLPLIHGALREGWPLYRIADGSPGRNPFDIGGCAADGRGVGLEVKVVRSPLPPGSGVPWGQFELHQREWLRTFASRGALALAGLYFKAPKVMALYYVRPGDELKPLQELTGHQLTWNPSPGYWSGWTSALLKFM